MFMYFLLPHWVSYPNQEVIPMPYTTLAQSAVDWALSKTGCAYSQVKRTQEDIFDGFSFVVRASPAQPYIFFQPLHSPGGHA